MPAHHLLHASFVSSAQSPSGDVPVLEDQVHNNISRLPLRIPSEAYDSLRATVVQAELLVLRILGFELRLLSPFEYLSRYLVRIFGDAMDATEDYDALSEEIRNEYGVLPGGILETRVGRMVKAAVVEACKNEMVGVMFPSRVVALGCIWIVLEERGIVNGLDASQAWVDKYGGGKVTWEDWEEVVKELRASPIRSSV